LATLACGRFMRENVHQKADSMDAGESSLLGCAVPFVSENAHKPEKMEVGHRLSATPLQGNAQSFLPRRRARVE